MTSILSDSVRSKIHDVLPEILELRHRIHQNPELKFEERQTMALIRDYLSGGEIKFSDPLIGTDSVGLLRGARPGPTTLLRADIDALPIKETSGKPWQSARDGKAHSCGHDGHVAMLLGAAKVLDACAGELCGNVRFVFQPAEEEIGGGKAMVAKGLMELVPVADRAFAIHGWSGLGAGLVSGRAGATMAAADTFTITVRGKGGHGAQPHKTADPILTAAQLVEILQEVVARRIDPLKPVVLSVCKMQGGCSSNVIPETVLLEGTVRYFDSELKEQIRSAMVAIVNGVCSANGCKGSLNFVDGYVPTISDPHAVAEAHAVVTAVMGEDSWSDDHTPSMATEDFSYYLNRVSGCLLRLGLGEDWPPLHSPDFDFNDAVLEKGVTLLVSLALSRDLV